MRRHEQRIERYRRGRKVVARAIAADGQGRLDEAGQLYQQGCEYLLAGLALDTVPKSRANVIKAVQGYVERAEHIAEAVARRDAARQRSVAALPAAPDGKTEASERFEQEGKERAGAKGFQAVAGLQAVKTALREAVLLPMRHPKAFVGGRKPWRGVLLYGPPGTGKSHVAAALSREADCTFISVSASDIVSKHQGDSERALRALFERARASRPCVIFLDEVDSIGRSRGAASGSGAEASRRLLTELLRQMDGVGTDMDRITVVAATNHPFDIDSALRRRFEKRIYVPMPGPKARAKILQLNLGTDGALTDVSNADLREVAARAAGYSGSDLANVANEALMLPVRRCLRATHFRYVPGTAQPAAAQSGILAWLGALVGGSSGTEGKVLVPCDPSAPGAMRMSMLDPSFPSDKLRVPPVTRTDLVEALAKLKPSVDRASLERYRDFAATFGEKDAVADFEDVEDGDEADQLAPDLSESLPAAPAAAPRFASARAAQEEAWPGPRRAEPG